MFYIYSPLSSRLSSFTGIYILDIVPGIIAVSTVSRDWIFTFYFGNTTPETTKAIKVSTTAIGSKFIIVGVHSKTFHLKITSVIVKEKIRNCIAE